MRQPDGMRSFYLVWGGQSISTLGSYLISFALGIWIYEETNSVSLLALNMLVFVLPELVLSPVAGAIADRFNRRTVMIVSDFGAALSSVFLLVVMSTSGLELWHVYAATTFNAICKAFQFPAESAALPQIVPAEQLGRANGLIEVSEAISYLFGPVLAGLLYVNSNVGIHGMILIDVLTFGAALITLLMVRFPPPTRADGTQPKVGKIWDDIAYGWVYVFSRRGLFGLMLYFALLEFFQEFTYPLIQPLLLDIATPDTMGWSFTIMGLGMLVGMGIMSVWDSSKYRAVGMLVLGILEGFAMILAGSAPGLIVITIGGFIYFMAWPVVEASNRALWQSAVAPDVQGRAFALRSTVAAAMRPIALLTAGPLADRVFTPMLMPGGALASSSIGQIIGVGEGRGIGLFIMILGAATVLISVIALLYRPVRNLGAKAQPLTLPEPATSRIRPPGTGPLRQTRPLKPPPVIKKDRLI
jgi:MFS family permease